MGGLGYDRLADAVVDHPCLSESLNNFGQNWNEVGKESRPLCSWASSRNGSRLAANAPIAWTCKESCNPRHITYAVLLEQSNVLIIG